MDWGKLKVLKKEHFDQPQIMDETLLFKLDALCQEINSNVKILTEVCPRHSHYSGKSVDVIFPEFQGSLLGLYLVAERLNFSHIGLYPDWTMIGSNIGGLHLEMDDLEVCERGNRWIGIEEFNYDKIVEGKPERKTKFLGLTLRNLKRLKVMK